MADRPWVVVPCYNEAERLDEQGFQPLFDVAEVLFVDDGSADTTLDLLQGMAARHPHARVLALERNQGKAGAVRAGLQHAMAEGAEVVGYLDADLATSAPEAVRLLDTLRSTGAHAVFGARVRLLGRPIERPHLRHWLGRSFATAASLILRMPVYDTQCGAKWFRADPTLQAALATPFRARWAFDVELCGRLLVPAAGVEPWPVDAFIEVPLKAWTEVEGSKVTRRAFARAGIDLVVIAAALARRRAR